MRLYLDVCCLNRPFDDQSVVRNRLEAEAVFLIIRRCRGQIWTWLSSSAIDYEIRRTPDLQRRALLTALSCEAHEFIGLSAAVEKHGRHFKESGFHRLDALHLALAAVGRADAFLTTDDRLLRRAEKFRLEIPFIVGNPISWLLKEEIK